MDEPIDLAHKAAEKGNPWFGLGNVLTANTQTSASGTLTLADLEALMQQMFNHAHEKPVFSIHPKRMHWLQRMYAHGKRYARRQKIRKRQRRAAQRRHTRGEK